MTIVVFKPSNILYLARCNVSFVLKILRDKEYVVNDAMGSRGLNALRIHSNMLPRYEKDKLAGIFISR